MLISLVYAGLNRKWRGLGQAPRWAWYAFMGEIAYCMTLSLTFTAVWELFLVAYAMLPWQAMFSAVNNQPPARKDSKVSQWMQDVALWSTSRFSNRITDPDFWHKYGIDYGMVRALPMVTVVLGLPFWLHSGIPLVGLGFISMGYIYYFSGQASRAIDSGTNFFATTIAEPVMGYLIGEYLECLSRLVH